MFKTLVVMAAMVLTALGTAEAQLQGTGAHAHEAATSDAAATTSAVITVGGWYYFHIAYCSAFGNAVYFLPTGSTVTDGNGVAYGVAWFATTAPNAYATWAPACQGGNLVAVHVLDASLVWDQSWTFNHP
jgi:hypothetical protein